MKEVKILDRVKDEILESKELPEAIKDELLEIYYEYRENGIEEHNSSALREKVDRVLEKMFKTAFGFTIPMAFIDSGIGKVLLKVKLEAENLTEIMYGATECAILANKSRSMIIKYFNSGQIGGVKTAGRFYAQEEEVIRFLTSVGRDTITLEEARKRIKKLNELREEGIDLEEIKNRFKYDKSWMNEKKGDQ